MNRNSRIPVLMAVLAIFLLACGPVATVVVTATPEPTAAVTAMTTPTAAPPASVSPTEVPSEPTTAAGCTLGARWVADVTVPDNTEFAPGTAFVKTWRVRNSGTCNWEPGTKLVFVSGDGMGGPGSVDAPALAAGAQTDVSVSLVAPASPGTYRGNWQFQAPDGTRFGATMWVQIVVPAPATATSPPPTAAPTEAPTAPPPTAAPLADLYISEYTVTPDPCVMGSPCHIRIGVYNGGNAAAGAFRVEWWATIAAPSAACTWDVPSLPAHGGRILECDYTYGGWARYTTRAIADPDNTVAESNEGNNNWDKEMTPEHSLMVTLSPVSRGQVDSGGDILTGVNNAGDTSGNRGLQGFLTFDVSSIPNGATIESARLETVAFDTLGDPFGSLSCLRVYVDNYGTLDAGDYTPPVTGAIARFCSAAELNDASAQELNSLGVDGIQSALASNQFQIRLQFNTRETDGDGVADVVRANFRLVVRYR